MSSSAQKLSQLRSHMKSRGVHAYIIPHGDAHSSEYICDRDERIAFISGFTGSAGTAVVTEQDSLLWTDGRYFQQAGKELFPEWQLMKDRVPGVLKISEYLIEKAKTNSASSTLGFAVGFDPKLFSISWEKDISEKFLAFFGNSTSAHLSPIQENLVDLVWEASGQIPAQPTGPINPHPLSYAGESVEAKLAKLRDELAKESCESNVISALDEIAWLFNLRGSDIPYNPVFFAYAIVTKSSATLFVDGQKLSAESIQQLKHANVDVLAYTDFDAALKTSNAALIDPDTTSFYVYSALLNPKQKTSPIQLWKACKNEAEVNGSRNAHIRDGLAKTKWLCWLESEMKKMITDDNLSCHHDEVTVADKLEEFRSQQELFKGLSFPSISSFGSNAAIIHYHAHKESCAKADINKIYLIDSGAQYQDGTTDVTRTVHFGSPTEREKDAYTRVLMGVISIASAVFPEGTTGPALDAIGRQFLWQVGMDFRHGIGHGVGAYMNVHEGPQGIGQPLYVGGRANALRTGLKKGMLLSDEPGFYEDGSFGIRIENVMVVTESKVKEFLTGKNMLTFETLTLIPIQKNLIKKEIMRPEHVKWLNEYHAKVYTTHEPHLNDEEKAWLKMQCEPI